MNTTSSDSLNEQLAELLADLKSPEEVLFFLQNFFSETELQTFAKRLEIIRLLSQNRSYQDIQHELKVSSATVANAAGFLETAIASKILYHVSVAHWADTWSQRISRLIGK